MNLFKFFLATILTVFAVSAKVQAHHLFVQHEIECSKEFPCEDALKPRISFWMDIFSKYSIHEAVFHDPDEPSRVYSVLQTESSCPRKGKEPSDISAERKRIEDALIQLRDGGDADEHFRSMFPAGDKDAITKSADNVRCQKGIKENYLEGLKRHAMYKGIVSQALLAEGLHEDYQYLPFVESSYNPEAYSFVGAAGMWQLMPKTARLGGLIVTHGVDQRLDPFDSSRVAASFIKNTLHRMMEGAIEGESTASLAPFILTSYNYGPGGMVRAVKSLGPNYLDIINNFNGRRFGVAVKNFYPSFLAAREVAMHAGEYIGPVESVQMPPFDLVVLPAPASAQRIATVLEVDLEAVRPLNPAIRDFVWNDRGQIVPKGYRLRVPKEDKNWNELALQFAKLPAETTTHIVQQGENLSVIAKQYRVPISGIQTANQLNGTFIRAGQKLVIPGISS